MTAGGHTQFRQFDPSKCGWAVTEWFARYSDDAECQIGQDGWPVPLPVVIGEAFRIALAQFNPSGDQIELAASQIYTAAAFGRLEELPRSRPAASKKTEQQLWKLHKMCGEIAAHIEAMNQPAVSALFLHNCKAGELSASLREAQYAARAAFNDYVPGPKPNGRPPKVEAREVTLMAANHFHAITGKRPTYTTNPASGAVTGLWPSTLDAVFQSMRMDASVASQVAWLQDVMPPSEWTEREKTTL